MVKMHILSRMLQQPGKFARFCGKFRQSGATAAKKKREMISKSGQQEIQFTR